MKSSTYLRIVTAWWIAAIALIAFGALAKAQTPAGVINAPIYATGAAAVATTFYISSNNATGFVVTFGAAASSAKYQYTCFGR